MTERATETYLTVDGSGDLKAQINDPKGTFSYANVDTTNMGSGGMMERKPTLSDWTVTVNLVNPDSDESSAASLNKILWDGSILGGGDSIYTVVIQKVSTGGTGGTQTTKDPKYTAAMVVDGWSPVSGNTGGLVNQGDTITFSNATAATFARATA